MTFDEQAIASDLDARVGQLLAAHDPAQRIRRNFSERGSTPAWHGSSFRRVMADSVCRKAFRSR